MTDRPALLAALASIQARGAIGPSSLDDAVAHAGRFVLRIPSTARTLADLGSGGGLPGLVIAASCPELAITLVERREMRADLLRRAVRSLGMDERVVVHGGDVRTLADQAAHQFDVVTARSFAAPPVTARWGSELLVHGGVLLVSEPPEDDGTRWTTDLLAPLGLVDGGLEQGIRCLQHP